ncbi:MAG: oligosaccharide flippase family protein [Rubrobacteraceae bacterium]
MVLRRVKAPPRFVMLASFGGTSVLNYAFGLIMGWLLLPGDFGWLAFAQTILLFTGLVLQSGFSWSLARAVANAERSRRDALVRGALVANLALAAVVGAAVVTLFALGPLRPGLETWTVSAIVALSLPFIAFAATARGCAQGSERFDLVATLQVTEISCKVLSGTALVLLGFGVTGAVAGFLIGAVFAAALGLYHLVRRLGMRLRDVSGGDTELPALRIAGPMFGALLGLSLLLNLDLVSLKLLSDERALTGYYQAGLVLANAPYYLVMSALVPVLFVQLARLESVPATRKALGETLGLTVALVLPLEFVLMIVPEQALVALFPDSYAPGAPALRLLAVGNALLILTAVFSAAFQAVGRAKVSALILLAVAFVEPVALWAVVPTWEAIGAASVFVVAASIALFSLGTVYLRGAGVEAARRAASWLFRYATAVGIGVVAGQAALGMGSGVNLAVGIGGACYLTAVFPLRLVRPPTRPKERPLLRKIATPDKE